MALQSDGKIVVAGQTNGKIAIARYLSGQPTILTSPAGSNPFENQKNVVTLTAVSESSQPLLYGITGGADQVKFAINSFTGVLTFVAAPDF